ncbi:Ig-like domain-containing protein, partial [Chlorobium limicola]
QLDHSADGNTEGLLDLDLSGVIVRYDEDGDSATAGSGSLLITVQDDVPIAVNDSNALTDFPAVPTFHVVEGGDISKTFEWNNTTTVINSDGSTNPLHYGIDGNVLANDFAGADAPARLATITYTNESGVSTTVDLSSSAAGTTVDTRYGQLSLFSDGKFEYISDPFAEHTNGEQRRDLFTYTLDDADGDRSSASFAVIVQDTQPTLTADNGVVVYEKNLPSGSQPDNTLLHPAENITIVEGKDTLSVRFNTSVTDFPETYLNAQEQAQHDNHVSDSDTYPEDGTKFKDLTSGGESLKYYINSSKDKIIAYTGTLPSSGIPEESQIVFMVELSAYEPSSDHAPYTFTLKQPLDHTPDILQYDSDTEIYLEQVQLEFPFRAYEPQDNDFITTPVKVTIVDERLDGTQPDRSVTTPEDDDVTAFTGNADTTSTNTKADGTDGSVAPLHGDVVFNDDGTYTYTPDPDYSGPDSLTFVHTDEAGVIITTTTVNVTVTPVSDAPVMTADAVSVITPEDQPVALGFNVPVVKDDTDGSPFTTDEHDNPERLGLITLSGIPANADLYYGTTIRHMNGSDITVYITDLDENNDGDNDHLSTLTSASATISMTRAEFEAMRVLPPPDTNANFTVTMSVGEYEVDKYGEMLWDGIDTLSPVAPETSTATVSVVVWAVTDHVDLQWTASAPDITIDPDTHPYTDSFDLMLPIRSDIDSGYEYIYTTVEDGKLNKWVQEDSSFNLKDLLEYTAVDNGDTSNSTLLNPEERADASEQRYIVLSNLPAGMVVNGTTIDASGTISVRLTDDKALPDINITPPKDFSGDLKDIKVTLTTIDTDSTGETGLIVMEEDYVMLDLYVTPKAGDITASDITDGVEDTAIKFLNNLAVTDKGPVSGGDAGTETITAIVVYNVPAGWVIRDNAGTQVTPDGSGNYTITVANYKDYTITPPAHSSLDGAVKVEVKTSDTATVDGKLVTSVESTTVLDVHITVTPVAEVIGPDSGMDGVSDDLNPVGHPVYGIIDPDSDGDGIPDLQMNGSFTFSVSPDEDVPFTFHGKAGNGIDATGLTTVFDFKSLWSNADAEDGLPASEGSEYTYALLEPMYKDGSDYKKLYGSTFTYEDGSGTHTLRYKGDPVEIPAEYLDTVTFTPVAHFAGPDVKMVVQAKTVDFDQDHPGDLAYADTKITGKVELYFDVTHKPDIVTLAAYSPGGYEDGSATALDPSRATASAIPLYINPQSDDTDGSESFNVTISYIPSGAKIIYDGTELTVVAGSVTINGFDSSKTLGIIPPANSDADIVLKVSGESIDGTSAPVPFGVTLSLPVQVTGVADTAVLTDIIPPSTFDENDVDTTRNHRIPLTSAVSGSPMVDSDGSETLTVRITALDAQFDIEGATYLSGSGTDRIWVVKASDLDGVNIIVPNNFSGDITFTGTPVTSEREGSVLTGIAQDFTIRVIPSPESTMILDTELNEDELKKLVFGIVQGPVADPDTDEELQRVYLKVGGAGIPDGVEGRDFTLYYGAAGTTALEDAVTAGYINIVTITTPDGPVQAYELDGTADYDNIYVRYGSDTDGISTFKATYDIFDPATGTITNCCNDYTLTVNAVTDPITESLGTIAGGSRRTVSVDVLGFQTVSAFGYTIFTVPVTVSQVDQGSEGPNGVDVDGSEKLLRFMIDGVPQGVSVEGAVYAGDVWDAGTSAYVNSGRWILYDNREFDGSPDLMKDITFNVDGTAAELAGLNQMITITAYSQDQGTDPSLASSVVEHASATFILTTPADAADFDESDRPTTPPPTVSDWNIDESFSPVEDTPAPLSDLVTTPVLTGPGAFTVTLAGLPAGSVVAAASGSGYTVEEFTQGGETVYSISGNGDTTVLQDMLSKVNLTTPLHDNSNNSAPIILEMTITTYAPGSNQANEVATSTPLVIAPVTDATTIIIDAPSVLEDNSETFTITFSNSADNQPGYPEPLVADHTVIVDGNVYLKLDTSAMTPSSGGKLFYGGAEITPTIFTASPATGVPAGTYYVITSVDDTDTLSFTYTPALHASGTVTVTAYALSQETGSTVTLTNSSSATFDITPVNDGYDLGTVTASGSEDDALIQLMIDGTGLVDTDGSEKVVSALLENVPNGYLVYYGADSDSAVLALNVGAAGSGNTWALPLNSGDLPAYIAVKPPKHVSGDVSGMQLTVYSRESELTLLEKTFVPFTLEVAPVADAVKPDFFKPTKTFGTEGAHIPLNLNLILDDQDGSETATLTFTGIGANASFYDKAGNDVAASYNSGTDTYTLTGIPAYDSAGNFDVNNLFVVQSARTGSVTATAYTVDTATGYTTVDSSDLTQTAVFTLDISEKVSTTNADTLLYDGTTSPLRTYDGLAGDDTLVLRQGEGIAFDDPTTARLRNIEIIDLSVSGVNTVSSLDASDVLAITDDRNTLYILGTSEDSVELSTTGGVLWNSTEDNITVLGRTMDKWENGSATVYVQDGVSIV